MNDRIRRQYNTLGTLSTFITDNAADFSAGSALPGYATQMKGIIKQMDDAKAGQLGGSGADVTDGLLDALKTDLQNIGGIARTNDVDHPGLKDKFPTVGTTAQSILSTADAYLDKLEIQPGDSASVQATKTALAKIFTDHEMPGTFVADLRADRDAVPQARTEQQTKTSGKELDTASLSALARKGMETRDKAIAALRARYSREADKLRAAEAAAHVERAPKREKKEEKSGGTGTANQ